MHTTATKSNASTGNMNAYLKTASDLETARKFLFKHSIKTIVEGFDQETKQYPSTPHRVAFQAVKARADFRNPLVSESNGAVFEYCPTTKKFRELLRPLGLFSNNKLKQACVRELLDSPKQLMDVMNIWDGTTIGVYFYQGKWRVATYKAYDATEIVFVDGKTYGNIFEEVMSSVGARFSSEHLADTSIWNPAYCYNICIQYPGFHLSCQSYGAVLLGVTDVFNSVLVRGNDLQAVASRMNIFVDKPIHFTPTKSVGRQDSRSANGMNSSLYYHISGLLSRKNCMGFILRAKPSAKLGDVPAEYRNIIMEGDMFKRIRQSFYNLSFMEKLSYVDTLLPPQEAQERNRNLYNMQDINSLYKFLNVKTAHQYTTLAPSKKELFAKYNDFLQFLTKCIYKNLGFLESTFSQSTETDLSPLLEGVEFQFPQAQRKLDILIQKIFLEMKAKKINLSPVHAHSTSGRPRPAKKTLPVQDLDNHLASATHDMLKLNGAGMDSWGVIADILRNTKWVEDYYSILYLS